MAGRINQVQLVGLAVLGRVQHRDRMGLDGDAPLAFQVHRIEQLVLHVAGGDGAGAVQQAVRKRRLPMINMGNDAEISDMRCVHREAGVPRQARGNWRKQSPRRCGSSICPAAESCS